MIFSAQVWPRKVIFGTGSLKELKNELTNRSIKRAIIITDSFLARSDITAQIRGLAEEVGCSVSLFGEAEANPSDNNVNNAAQAVSESGAQLIIAFGGGSAMDCAKAANVTVTHGGSVTEYMGPMGSAKVDRNKLLPLIAIPSTAGTASEVSNVAVVTHTQDRRKSGITTYQIVPDVSLLDPMLTLSLPPNITAWTGMDALTHAVESYISNVDFPVGNMLALDAIRLIVEFLPQAVANEQDILAREKMLLGSHVAGIAMNCNRLGLVHSIAHQMSSEFGLNHGLANAVALPVVMRFSLESAPQKYAEVARALGVKARGLTDTQLGEKGIQAVERLMRRIGIPKRITEYRLTDESLERMTANAMKDALRLFSPRVANEGEIREIYRQIF